MGHFHDGGQQQVLGMLSRLPPVGTEASKQAVRERMALEQRWEAVEQEILQTANDAQRDTHKAG